MSTTNSGNQIGIAREAMVELALLEIVKPERRKKRINPPIVKYVRAEKNSEMDARGVDFLITQANGTEIGIDVKSSVRRAQQTSHKNRRQNRLVGIVVVLETDTVESVVDKIIYCIKNLAAAVRRRRNQRLFVHRIRQKNRAQYHHYLADHRDMCSRHSACFAH